MNFINKLTHWIPVILGFLAFIIQVENSLEQTTDCDFNNYTSSPLFNATTTNNDNSAPNNTNNDGYKIGTYRSTIEILIEDIGSLLPGNDTFIGKSFSEVLSKFQVQFHAIFPGTHWCGPGNNAADYDDLGLFYKTDKCCRDHDNCPNDILSDETQGPLINNGIFTRSSCDCDHSFYTCLKNVNSIIASSIGDTYFNILRPQCFEVNYPVESCEEYNHLLPIIIGGRKCIKYKFDTSKNETLQWFDNPDF